jgi:hypothetical protein
MEIMNLGVNLGATFLSPNQDIKKQDALSVNKTSCRERIKAAD